MKRLPKPEIVTAHKVLKVYRCMNAGHYADFADIARACRLKQSIVNEIMQKHIRPNGIVILPSKINNQ